jgi:uncharacterized protein YdhG (YjbR/CyaY superfamily)
METAPGIKFKTIEEYTATSLEHTREHSQTLRNAIRQAAPQAEEVISYNMPAFKFNGPLVFYAAYKQHIGFYPTPSAIKAFKDELTNYKTSKGAIQFPLDKPIPIALVKKFVAFRVKENAEKAAAKAKKIK